MWKIARRKGESRIEWENIIGKKLKILPKTNIRKKKKNCKRISGRARSPFNGALDEEAKKARSKKQER